MEGADGASGADGALEEETPKGRDSATVRETAESTAALSKLGVSVVASTVWEEAVVQRYTLRYELQSKAAQLKLETAKLHQIRGQLSVVLAATDDAKSTYRAEAEASIEASVKCCEALEKEIEDLREKVAEAASAVRTHDGKSTATLPSSFGHEQPAQTSSPRSLRGSSPSASNRTNVLSAALHSRRQEELASEADDSRPNTQQDMELSSRPSESLSASRARRRLHTSAQSNSQVPSSFSYVDDLDYDLFRTRTAVFQTDTAPRQALLPPAPAGSSDDAAEASETETLLGPGSRRPPRTPESSLSVSRLLWTRLFEHQKSALHWLSGLHEEKVGGILADDMGLGKTVCIAVLLEALLHAGIIGAQTQGRLGCLIVSPATVVDQWLKELHTWCPGLRVCVYHNREASDLERAAQECANSGGALITTYETLRTHQAELLAYECRYLILDEGQKIRNPNASITIAVKRFNTPHRLLLSGSPIQNHLRELWSLFDFVFPGRLATLPLFEEQFATPIEQGGRSEACRSLVLSAYTCAVLLRSLTEPYLLRRSKAEVDLQLPNKSEQVLFCHLTPLQYRLYMDLLSTLKYHRSPGDLPRAFLALTTLRKLCNHPDLVTCKEKPQDFGCTERSGKLLVLSEILRTWLSSDEHRVLVFSQSLPMLGILESFIYKTFHIKTLLMTGQTAMHQRQLIVDRFNSRQHEPVMLLSTRVGGVGLNLSGADRVVIFDPDWNPMTDTQARERSWRIGQDRDVVVYRLVCSGTLEDKIYQRQIYKHFLALKVLEDPRQKGYCKWNNLKELFEPPTAPPNLIESSVPEGYRKLFREAATEQTTDGGADDERDILDDVQLDVDDDLERKRKKQKRKPRSSAVADEVEEPEREHNRILETLYRKQGIEASIEHDRIEQPNLDQSLVAEQCDKIAATALRLVNKSYRERMSHGIDVPTWTGRCGTAGIPGSALRDAKVAVERKLPASSSTSSVCSKSILAGLKRLSQNTTQDVKLHRLEKQLAKNLLEFFLGLQHEGYRATTGQVIEQFGPRVPEFQKTVFRALLLKVCKLDKSTQANCPSYWELKDEYRV